MPKREGRRKGRFEIWRNRELTKGKKEKGRKPDDSKRPIKRTQITWRELRGPALGSESERRPSGQGPPQKGSAGGLGGVKQPQVMQNPKDNCKRACVFVRACAPYARSTCSLGTSASTLALRGEVRLLGERAHLNRAPIQENLEHSLYFPSSTSSNPSQSHFRISFELHPSKISRRDARAQRTLGKLHIST